MCLAAAVLASVAAPPAVFAGSFSVSPVRIFMQARERATAITVVNEGDTELVMQAELFTWKQKADGADELAPTEDIVLAPPILKMAPRSRQVVRLANLKPVAGTAQQTYRMLVREIPEARPAREGVEIQVALAFSLPVFITPPGAKSKLVCELGKVEGPSVTAVCDNRGEAYAQPVSLTLTTAGGEVLVSREITGGYVLPQVRRSFDLQRAAGTMPRGPAQLTVTQDDGSKQVFDVRLGD
jgi:fimbrial chaperone protein